MLIDQAWCIARGISYHIVKLDYIRPTEESLKDLDFSVDLFYSNRFEDLDDTFLVVLQIHTLVYL
jgi:hypothetical protein